MFEFDIRRHILRFIFFEEALFKALVVFKHFLEHEILSELVFLFLFYLINCLEKSKLRSI